MIFYTVFSYCFTQLILMICCSLFFISLGKNSKCKAYVKIAFWVKYFLLLLINSPEHCVQLTVDWGKVWNSCLWSWKLDDVTGRKPWTLSWIFLLFNSSCHAEMVFQKEMKNNQSEIPKWSETNKFGSSLGNQVKICVCRGEEKQ